MELSDFLHRLTDGMADAEDARERLRAALPTDVPGTIAGFTDLMRANLAVAGVLPRLADIGAEINRRRAAAFTALARQLPGPHLNPMSAAPVKRAPKPKAVPVVPEPEQPEEPADTGRVPRVKSVEEAHEVVLEVCAAEDLAGIQDLAVWETYDRLTLKYPRLAQALQLLLQ